MAVQLTLTDISSGYQGTEIQANFTAIEDEFDKVVYRDGSLAMSGDLDMNSQRMLNLPAPTTSTEPLRKADNLTFDEAQQLVTDAETAKTAAETAQTGAETAESGAVSAKTDAEAALAELEGTDLLMNMDGDFDPDSTIRTRKSGDLVTIQSLDDYDHTVGVSASSASSVISAEMRPPLTIDYGQTMWTATGVVHVSIDGLGRVNALHYNYDGTTRSGLTVPAFSISYLVSDS